MGGESKSLRTETEDEKEESESEDWCFVCKDGGGTLRLCDFRNCGKAYHFKCVGQKRSFLKSESDWHCWRHTCSHCGGTPTCTCYSCPKAICHQCMDAAEFTPIKGKNGFCKKCMQRILIFERKMQADSCGKRMNFEGIPKKRIYFKEYYEIIKEKEGFTLDDIQSAKELQRTGEKRRSSLSLDEVDGNKRLRGLHKIIDSNQTSHNEEVVSSILKTSFASLVPENVELVYLRRSLVQKLLKQPESFEEKVKGTFVRVELPPNDARRAKTYKLVQVTGITSSDEGNLNIKLQASNMPDDISLDMVSNANFSEEECEVLREQVKVGLLKKLTVEELEGKARILREDMIDDFIARELRKLQPRMDRANEEGRRQEYFLCFNRKKQLQEPSERLWLIHSLPKVITEVLDVKAMSEETVNGIQGTEGSPESIPINGSQSESNEIASETDVAKKTLDALDARPTLKDIVDNTKQNGGSADLISKNKEWEGNKPSPERLIFNTLPGTSTLYPEHVKKQVYEPVVNNASPPIPVTSDTQTEKDTEQQLQEIKQNKVIQEQKGMSKRMVIEQPVEHSGKQIFEEQQSMSSIPPPSREGGLVSPAHFNPALLQHLKNQSCSNRGLDISDPARLNDAGGELVNVAGLPCEHGLGEHCTDEELLNSGYRSTAQLFLSEREILSRSEKIFEEQKRYHTMHQKLEMNVMEDNKIIMLEDELKSLKIKMEENARISAAKITSLEKKLDHMFEQHVKQIQDIQVQSAKEAITSYKKSQVFVDDVSKLLDPICTAARTKMLEEVKANHLPDLDLNKFLSFNPIAGEQVKLILEEIRQSYVQVDWVRMPEPQPLACQAREEVKTADNVGLEDGKLQEIPPPIPQE